MRVDIMMEKGLLKEAKELYEKYGENLRKINIIGYTQLIDYFDNNCTLEEAVENKEIQEDMQKDSLHGLEMILHTYGMTWIK
jgi:tRNA dimethylallyltransferase